MSVLDKLLRNDQGREQRPDAELKRLFGKGKSRREQEQQQDEQEQDGSAVGRLARIALGKAADGAGDGVEKLQGKVDDFQGKVQGTVDDVQDAVDSGQATARKKFPGKGEKVHAGIDKAQEKVDEGVAWGQAKVDEGQASVQAGVDKVLDPIKTPKAKKQQPQETQETERAETESETESETEATAPQQPEKKKKKGLFGALAKVGIKPELSVGGFEIGIDDEKVSVDGKAGTLDVRGEQEYGKGKKLGRDANVSAQGTVAGADVNLNARGTESGIAADGSVRGNMAGTDVGLQASVTPEAGLAGTVEATRKVGPAEVTVEQELGRGKRLGRDASLEARAEVLGFPVKGGIDGKDVFKDEAPALAAHEATHVTQQKAGRLEKTAEGMSDREKLARQVLDGGAPIEKGDAGYQAVAGVAEQSVDDSGAAKKQKKPGERLTQVALANDEQKLAADGKVEEKTESANDKGAAAETAKLEAKAKDKDTDREDEQQAQESEQGEDENKDAKHLPGKVGAVAKAAKKELEHQGRDAADFADASKKKLAAKGATHEKQAVAEGHEDKPAKKGKLDGKLVDGHAMGLVIDDDKAAKKPGKPDKRDKLVDGHAMGVDVPGKLGGKLGDEEFESESESSGITDTEGNSVPYTPGKAAPQPQASKGAQPGGFAKPKAPPELPAVKPQTPSQEAMQAYVDKARKDREAARATVKAQERQKTQQVNVDANVIKAQVASANNAKLAELRKKAEADKAAAAKKAAEEQKAEGPVTIESLKQKLETESTADKERLKQTFDTKKAELQIRLQTQKQTLQTETQKQIDNWTKQQADQKAKLQAEFDRNKKEWEQTAKNLQEQMKQQVAADKKRLEDNRKQLEAKTLERMKELEAKANANAAAAIATGEKEAKRLRDRGAMLGKGELAKAEQAASAARDGTDAGEKRANDLLAGGRTRQADLVAKGERDAKDVRAKAKTESEGLIEKGKQAVAAANRIAANQVTAIDEKIGQLEGLAQERIAKAQADLDKRVADGLKNAQKAQDESKAKIDKLKAEAEQKLASLETDALTKLQTDYDREVAAIDKRVEAARKQLATGNAKNVAAMQKMVDQTLQAIDKGIEQTEKKFEATVQDAEKKAMAFVLAQLQKIKGEADKALAAIDKVFDDAMAHLKTMAEQVHRDIEETSKGKMLEVEVHTATVLADLGDKSKLDAVRATIKAYLDAGRPLPAGYAAQAKPQPKKGPDGKPIEEKPAEKKPEDTVAELQQLDDPTKKDGETFTAVSSDKDKQEQQREKTPDELAKELDARVDAEIKKAQTATSLAAYESTKTTLQTQADESSANMKKFVEGKEVEQNDLAAGKKDAVDKARAAEEAKKQGEAAAKELEDAFNYWGGTDEAKIFASLKGKTPEQIEAIKEAYKAKTGRDLDADLAAELGGDELKEARAMLANDPIGQRVAAIQNSMSFWGNDKDKIKEALYGGDPKLTDEQRQQLIKQYEIDTGTRLDKVLGEENIEGVTPADFAAKGPELKQDELDAALKDAKNDAAAQHIINATVGDKLGTGEESVYKALEGKTPEQIEAIKRAFKAKTNRDLEDVLEEEMSGAELKEAKALMSGDATRIAVAKLDNAAHGGIMPGTDTGKIHKTLEEIKDPAERRRVKEAYERQTGQKLDEMLDDELSGHDKDLAKAYAGGDPAEIAAVKADKAMHGGFLTDIADGIADTVGADREAMRKAVGGGVVATIAGPFAPVVQVLQATGVTDFGTDTGTDEKALYEALEACPDEYSRMKLREAYKKRTGKDLDVDLKGELSGAESDVAKYIMEGDLVAAEAAKMKAGGEGAGTDKKMIFDALQKCKTPEERQRLIAKYNELYGGNGENFDQMLKNELAPSPASQLGWGAIGLLVGGPAGAATMMKGENDLDYQKAKLLSEGKMNDGFALYYAMNEGMFGFGTDDDALKKILKGPPQKTKKEIEELKKQYADAAKQYGKKDNANLFDDVMDETSGRTGHELKWAMKGKPETPEEIAEKQKADLEFERTETSWVGEVGCFMLMGPLGYGAMKAMGVKANDVGNALTDSWSDSGKNLEASHAEFQAKYNELLADPRFKDRDKYPPGSPERIAIDQAMMKELEKVTAVNEANLEDFQSAKDATADAAGTVAAVAVGAALTVASGGALGPVMISLISGAAGLGTTMAIKGGSMSNEEIGQKIVEIAAEAIAAGLVDVKAVKGLIGNVSALAGGEKALAGRIINEMLEEAIESGAEAMVTAIADPANYKGDPVDWLRNVTAATTKAAATGAFSAGVSTGAGDAWKPNGPLGKAIKGGTMQMVGGAASSAIDPATYEGSQDEKWGRFAKSQAEAAARGAYNSMGKGDSSEQDPGHDEYSDSRSSTETESESTSDTSTSSETTSETASVASETTTETTSETSTTSDTVAQAATENASTESQQAVALVAAIDAKTDTKSDATTDTKTDTTATTELTSEAKAETVAEPQANTQQMPAVSTDTKTDRKHGDPLLNGPIVDINGKTVAPRGLADPASIESYVGKMKDIEANWESMSPGDRAKALSEIINQHLSALGIPPVRVLPSGLNDDVNLSKAMGDGQHGALAFAPGDIHINAKMLNAPTVDARAMAHLAETVYHEARHAEQWFMMMKYMQATWNMSPKDIADYMSIGDGVANQALASMKPLTPDQMAEAKTYFESVYGANRGHREAVYAAQGDPSQAVRAQAEQAYLRLPEEADAHAVGNAVNQAYGNYVAPAITPSPIVSVDGMGPTITPSPIISVDGTAPVVVPSAPKAEAQAETETETESETEAEAVTQRVPAVGPALVAPTNVPAPASFSTQAADQQQNQQQLQESHPTRHQEIHLGNDTPARAPSPEATSIRTDLDQLQMLRSELGKPESAPGARSVLESRIKALQSELDAKLADPSLKDALLDPHVVFALARESAHTKGLPSSAALKQFLSANIDAVRAAQDQARQGVNPELRAKREVFEREIAKAILGDDRVKGMVDANLDAMCEKAIDYMMKSREGAERNKGLADLGIDPSQKAYAGAVNTGATVDANAEIMMDVLRQGNARERMIALGAFAELVARDMAADPSKFEAVAAAATGADGEFSAADVAAYRARYAEFVADTKGGYKGDPNNEKDLKKFFGSFLKPTNSQKTGDQKAYQSAKGQDMDAKIPSVYVDDQDAMNPLAPAQKQETGMGEDSSLARSELTIAEAQAMGFNLSPREIRAAEANGGKLPLNIGSIANVVDPSASFIHEGSQSSMPQKAGISGTTFRFMQAATLLGGDPTMSRLAMIGALQMIDAHTIYEIAHAAAGFGPQMKFDPNRPYDNLGIDPEILAEIARACGTTIDELNGGKPEQAPQLPPAPSHVPMPQSQSQQPAQTQQADLSKLPQTADSARERKAAGEEWSNKEIRDYYNARNSEIAALDAQWQQEGKSLEERARLASELRHGMRMTARAMMGDQGQVLELLLRDAKKYGDGEGPTFDELVQQQKDRGLTGDAIYEAILGGSQRTDKKTNEKVARGQADVKPNVTIPDGVTIRGDYATVRDVNGSEVVVRIKGVDGNEAPHTVRNGDGTFEVRFGKDFPMETALQMVAAELGNIQSDASASKGASSGMANPESTYRGGEVGRNNAHNVRAGVNEALPAMASLFPPGSVTTLGPNRVAITINGTSHEVRIEVANGSLPVATDVANFDMTTTPITVMLSGTMLKEHVDRALSHELSEIRSILQQRSGGTTRTPDHNALATDSTAHALSHEDMGKLGELRVLASELKAAAGGKVRAEARAELIRLLRDLGMLDTHAKAFNTNGLGKQRQRLMEAEGIDFAELGAMLGFGTSSKRPNDPSLKLRGDHADPNAVPRIDVTPADVRPLIRPDVMAAFVEFGLSEETVLQYITDHHNDRSQQRYLADLEGLANKHAGTLDHNQVMLIDLYTTKLFYKELNTRLRGRDTRERDAAIKLAKLLNASLEKLPATTETMYRSINIEGAAELKNFLAQHKKGAKVNWKSYSSVGSEPGGTMDGNIMFIIRGATAYDITEFADGMAYKETPNPGRELLIPAGAKVEVLDATEVSPGQWHIEVKQTGSGAL